MKIETNHINLDQYYYSTYDFVSQNGLETEANDFFGENWESEDDVNQIQILLDNLFDKDTFFVHCIDGLKSDYDIQVIKIKTELTNG